MEVERRLEELRLRNRIALETLGPAGESVTSELMRMAREHKDARGREAAGPDVELLGALDFFVWDEYATGRFENIDRIALDWLPGPAADAALLAYRPDPGAPFAFIDSTGHRIAPGPFLTDGGSVPHFAISVSGITRWGYLPAFLIHDWEFVLKHCGQIPVHRSRELADRALLEALKTMMTQGLVPESKRHFWAIKAALGEFSDKYWDADTPCSLPAA